MNRFLAYFLRRIWKGSVLWRFIWSLSCKWWELGSLILSSDLVSREIKKNHFQCHAVMRCLYVLRIGKNLKVFKDTHVLNASECVIFSSCLSFHGVREIYFEICFIIQLSLSSRSSMVSSKNLLSFFVGFFNCWKKFLRFGCYSSLSLSTGGLDPCWGSHEGIFTIR